MRSAVKGCNNNNKSKPCTISFFSFPANADLQKQWKGFCCRDKKMNIKTSNICMKHFKQEDFENILEYEMGFTKRRFLKQGAVPSVKKTSAKNETLFKERAQRIEKRQNKQTVELLLKEYDAVSILVDDKKTCEPSPQFQEIDVSIEESVEKYLCDKSDESGETESLKNELERLRKENIEIKKAYKKQAAELKAIVEKSNKESKIQEYNLEALQTRLTKSMYELIVQSN